MAVVTLKDLMDPLTKIQAATESTAASIDALTVAVGTTGQSSGGAVQEQILKELKIQTKLMEQQKGGGLAGLMGGGKGKGTGGMAAGGNAFKMLGAGTAAMAKGLLIFTLVPTKTINKFNDFVRTQIEMWSKSDPKKMDKGAKAMMAMGNSILNFSKALALSALLLIPAAIGLPLLYIAVALITPLFLILGMAEKPIAKGAKSLDNIGDALKSFAVGLAVFALTTFFILMQPAILLGMVATLVLIGGAVAILGLFDKQIKKGSMALAFMGVGLLVFGLGYALFAFAVASTAPTLEGIAIQAGVLVGIGVVTALLGSLFGLIIQGAASLASMGIGLLVFGLGYIPFAHATKDVTLEDIGIQSALLTAMGLLFAAAGFGAVAIIPGAAAFAAIGVALLALAPGLVAIKKVDFTEDDALKLTTTLAGVKAAFIGPPSGGGVGGFFSSIGGALTGAVDSVKMIAAAAGFGAAGLSLIVLSKGLKAYQKLSWTSDQSLQLATVLSGISTAFAQAGGEAATPTGIFGKVFGNAFSPNATKKGISSVMDAGKALTNIAGGLTEFQKLVDSKVDFVVLGDAIAKTVGFIQRAFAAVAEEGNVEAGGFFGSLFGIKKNKVAEGLESVQGSGKALKDIAIGLTEFQKLVDSKVDFDVVGAAISKSVGFVQEALTDIAKGLKAFSGDFEPEAVSTSVGKLLTSIGTAFSDLYTANPEMSEELDDFKSFIVTLGDVAEKGQLEKAADGISKIADSINKIDIDKTVAFGDLFKSGSELPRRRDGYVALAKAVEEIRDIMSESSGGGGGIGGLIGRGVDALTGNTPKPRSNDSMKSDFRKLNTTLIALNSTMKQLPVSITTGISNLSDD